MSDRTRTPGRIDLRALSEDPQFGNVDRVMTAVLGGYAGRIGTPRHAVFAALVAHARPVAAAAAILVAASLASLALARGNPVVPPQDMLATWVRSNHVPTNAELLIAFEGYGR